MPHMGFKSEGLERRRKGGKKGAWVFRGPSPSFRLAPGLPGHSTHIDNLQRRLMYGEKALPVSALGGQCPSRADGSALPVNTSIAPGA